MACPRTRLQACSSSTTANARWWPVSPARSSTGPVARHDLRQNSFPVRRLARPQGVEPAGAGLSADGLAIVPAHAADTGHSTWGTRELASRSVGLGTWVSQVPGWHGLHTPGERSVGRGPGQWWQCRVVAWFGSRRWYDTRAARTGGHVWIGHQEKSYPRWSYS
jgi:hypothetical protein